MIGWILNADQIPVESNSRTAYRLWVKVKCIRGSKNKLQINKKMQKYIKQTNKYIKYWVDFECG